jgi:hypothetical protein
MRGKAHASLILYKRPGGDRFRIMAYERAVAWVEPQSVVNTWPWTRLHRWLTTSTTAYPAPQP